MKYTANDLGFTYAGQHASAFGAYLAGYSIPPSPSTRDNELIIPGQIGDYDVGTEIGRLDLTLQVGFWVASGGRAAINANIRAFMALIDPRNGYQALSLDDDPDFYLLAKMTSSTGTSQINPYPVGTNGEMAAVVDIAMKCADPHWYSTSHPAVTVATGVINNPGPAPVPVVITLTGTATTAAGVQKGVTIGGVQVGYSGPLNSGQSVIIDTGLWTLTKGGVNDIGNWYGEMPMLPGGSSTVTVQGSVTATIQYHPRWLA